MSDEIIAYKNALERFNAAKDELLELSVFLKDTSDTLGKYNHLIKLVNYPEQNANGGANKYSGEIDATHWPSVEHLAAMIDNYHNSKSEAHALYQEIPEAARSMVAPKPPI